MMKFLRVLGIAAAVAMIIFGFCVELPEKRIRVSSSSSAYDYDWEEDRGAEYVGGDAYNYQMEASLKAGYVAGVYVEKTVSIVGGIILLFISLYSLSNCSIAKRQVVLLEKLPDKYDIRQMTELMKKDDQE